MKLVRNGKAQGAAGRAVGVAQGGTGAEGIEADAEAAVLEGAVDMAAGAGEAAIGRSLFRRTDLRVSWETGAA
jgi:hypothetical protein